MARARRITGSTLVGGLLGVGLYVLSEVAFDRLPGEGWGLVLRWVLGVTIGLLLLVGLGQLLASAAREFRRGLAGERGRS